MGSISQERLPRVRLGVERGHDQGERPGVCARQRHDRSIAQPKRSRLLGQNPAAQPEQNLQDFGHGRLYRAAQRVQ